MKKETRELLYVTIIGILIAIFGFITMIDKPYEGREIEEVNASSYMEYYLEEFYGID